MKVSYFSNNIYRKKSRFGITSFVLCDSVTGYIQDLIVYSRANMIISEDIPTKSIGKSRQIVMTLFEAYLGKGHTLVTDNWYSSPNLFLELHKNLTNAYGTIRRNRLSISELNKNIHKEECVFRSTKNILALKWMDRRKVWMISTYHCSNMIDTNKIHYLTEEKIIKLQCIIDYNNTMGVVDKIDQICYSLNSSRKSLKWHIIHIFYYKFHLYLIKYI